ncbi:MAG: hypothetical protein AAF387_18505 [Pseudomonadota bacterium]
MTEAGTIKADPKLRLQVTVCLLLIVASGAIFVVWIEKYLASAGDNVSLFASRVYSVVTVLGLSLVPLAYCCWR